MQHDKQPPSEKNLRIFGLIWSGIFVFFYFKDDSRNWAILLLFSFLLPSLFCPQIFVRTKIYQFWIKFGDVMGAINSCLIIFLLFFFIFTPIGIFLRIFGKDLLTKKINRNSSTYFSSRKEQPGSMLNQF